LLHASNRPPLRERSALQGVRNYLKFECQDMWKKRAKSLPQPGVLKNAKR